MDGGYCEDGIILGEVCALRVGDVFYSLNLLHRRSDAIPALCRELRFAIFFVVDRITLGDDPAGADLEVLKAEVRAHNGKRPEHACNPSAVAAHYQSMRARGIDSRLYWPAEIAARLTPPVVAPRRPSLSACSAVSGTITQVHQGGFSLDLLGTLDSNPERVEFRVSVANADRARFREWLLAVSDGLVAIGHDLHFADLGDARLPSPIAVGAQIRIAFDEFFEAFLHRRCAHARAQIERACYQALQRLDLG